MRLTPVILATMSILTVPATAADGSACAAPRFSDVGWTDITATTAVANELLTALGYSPDVSVLSVAITFRALEQGDTDVFLGLSLIHI